MAIEFLGLMIEVCKYISKPIKRELSYLCCFSDKIQILEDEAGKVRDAKEGLQLRVDAAERNAEQILPEVVTLLQEADETQQKLDETLRSGTTTVSCLNLKCRYVWGKNAVKSAESAKQLLVILGVFKNQIISTHCLPASMVPAAASKWTMELGSREGIEENIMAALKSIDVNVTGICGLGGVGKTTMAERIMDRVRTSSEKLFDEVVKVVVSQEASITKIQGDFSEQLGLDLSDVEDLATRNLRLRTRLQTGKNILVVIDDVWKPLDLEEIGINWGTCEGRVKVILTSRNEDVCRRMGAQAIMKVDTLSEEEAWNLFREKVGHCVEKDATIHLLAKDVTEDCNGLPLALVTVGAALKGEIAQYVWKAALQQLRDANPEDIPQVLGDVYQPLRLSYDHVSPHAKSIFLLCGMFPEDHDIPQHVLSMLCFGLRVFGGVMDTARVRDRAFTLINELKRCSLLLDSYSIELVRMHDVVRDMAIYVASKEEHSFSVSSNCMDWLKEVSKSGLKCEWISLIPQEDKWSKFPVGLRGFPHLRLLMVRNVNFNDNEDDLKSRDEFFFDGMEELEALSLENSNIRSLALTVTQSLKSLRTLLLHYCGVECISAVGRLESLEILSCFCCPEIKELTIELKSLSCLRLLEMEECPKLLRIAPGVISSMTSLEEIKMVSNSFSGWELKIGNERNASLRELEFLTNLTCLHIQIDNIDLAAAHIKFPSSVNKFDIRFVPLESSPLPYYHDQWVDHIQFESERIIPLADWVCKLLNRTKILHLDGNVSSVINFVELDHLMDFYLENCSTVKNLVNASEWRCDALRLLKTVELRNLRNMEQICDAPILIGSNSFTNLRNLLIFGLDTLKSFPTKMFHFPAYKQ